MADGIRSVGYRRTLGPALLFLVIAGCADGDVGKSIVTANGPPLAGSSTTSTSSTPFTPSAASTVRALPSSDQQVDEAQAAFQYPFPDRQDIFLPPSGEPPVREAAPEEEHAVKLMGFANVGGLRALLKIDGIVATVQVGESRGGIRVLDIDPPKISLQRGTERWTESLFSTP